ncbi:recQ-mediated genome instability protein 1-like [Cotesia glomerata]|uniref:RecQ-mediated genome instability protein 1 n=1 Tax=Cotesia glomerata TaxID=32391 RepID=A0AAV7I0D9_COTGL|nr:recQ-mediated genome instability protein 1-like [Cotesia glomerata]KAH0539429.1 hypothetical protein KQX54_004746 [Cotesia glomerata]
MPFNYENVKIQLHAEHYLMNDCWLKDCVGYYTTEVNPQAVQAEIVKFVKDQWILSDLREINDQRGCLPENLAQQKVTTLPGTYILQVEKGYDISTSKYKQVEKIRNVSSENIEVTEAEKNPTWEPKTKRMMYLYLTDGKQEVTAMEHKPIPFLKDHLLPGYKIMIKGPVICRRSVIMLESKNCSHVGGEIESLLIKNATENVLARALGLKENPDPYNDKKSDDKNEPLPLDEGMDIDMDALDKIEKKYDDNTSIKPPKTKSSSVTTSRTKRRESVLLDSLPVCFDSIEQAENEFADDFDDMIGMIDEANLNVVGGGDKDVEIEEVKIEAENTRAGAFPEDDFPTDLEFDEFEFDSFPYEKTTNMLEDKVVSESLNNVVDASSSKIFSNATASSSVKSNVTISNAKNNVTGSNVRNNPTNSTKSNFNFKSSSDSSHKPVKQSNETVNKIPEKITPSFSGSEVSRSSPMKNDNKISPSNNTVINPFVTPSKNPPKTIRKETPKRNLKNVQKITDFMKKSVTPKSDESKTSSALIDNYDLIKDIEKLMPVSREIDKKIKGTIISLANLERRDPNWYLQGVVSDNTGSISVSFSPAILNRLIGFNLAEFSQMKKLKKTDPEVANKLRQGLRGAEFKLSHLHTLLRCKLLPNNPVLFVESMLDLTGGQRKEV